MLEFKMTQDLTSPVYADALMIRRRVFIDGQGVPESLEVDDMEAQARHIVGYQEGEPVVVARLIDKELGKTYKVQRVAVLADWRQHGFGKQLMLYIEDFALEQDVRSLILNAQNTAIGFYESLDYEIIGDVFLEAGIPHHTMRKTLSDYPL